MRPLDGLIWSSIGLALSLLATIAAGVILGTLYLPGWGPAASWAVYSVAYIVLSIVRVNQASTVPDLSRLEGDTRRMSIESQFEQRAAAIIHDTVLSDLTAVMNSGGPLDDRAREKFRADVATLKDPSWLREPGQAITVDHRDIALRNGTMALISEYQWRGLTVDLTGNNDSVVRLTDAATAAIHAALRACLDNVLAHSGTQSAEMVAGGNDVEITYMVIDHGVGFDPDAVPSTRLGLRHSVVGRIEEQGGSVRIWSRPGSGTSVLISVPQDAPDEIAGPAAPSEVDDAS
jgi:signal transduction histidine kinase